MGKHLRACVWACVRAHMMWHVCAHAPRRCARPPIARGRPAVLIARPGGAGRRRARGCGFGAIGVRCRARSAAGVTWTSRTASAQWDARNHHTSVVDAAGAIYVIGGYDGGTFADVWVSTDGGARAGLGPSGVVEGVHRVGTPRGTRGYYRGYLGVLDGYWWDTQGLLGGYMGGTKGIPGGTRGY